MKHDINKFIGLIVISIVAILALSLSSCQKEEDDPSVDYDLAIDDVDFETTDWTTDTHSDDADPDFDEVFQDNAVKRLDIVVREDRWQLMIEDMTSKYGDFGSGHGSFSSGDDDPVFVPAEVFYEGIEWYRVGIRFKGNSSLASAWGNGILKLSFKLDFDEFEDYYPQIDDQRFFGFKKLSLKNNYEDESMLREKVAGDVFRNAGLVASHTAFYTLYVDYGQGPVYFGVYTLVEEVDNTVIDTQYSDDDGNLYKPDGTGASFAYGTFSESVFVKKTNEDEMDWSDIQSLFSVLHDELRTTDPESWRANLESVFDTDVFLKYLAVNTLIQNWDTYGIMTHNYFLYNDPATSKLAWIPWDNNEALQDGKQGGCLSLNFSGLSASKWPLIGYLYADEVYKAQYDAYLREVADDAFSVSNIQSQYSTYSALIEPYATSEIEGFTFLESSSDFQLAVNELNAHVVERSIALSNYLN